MTHAVKVQAKNGLTHLMVLLALNTEGLLFFGRQLFQGALAQRFLVISKILVIGLVNCHPRHCAIADTMHASARSDAVGIGSFKEGSYRYHYSATFFLVLVQPCRVYLSHGCDDGSLPGLDQPIAVSGGCNKA